MHFEVWERGGCISSPFPTSEIPICIPNYPIPHIPPLVDFAFYRNLSFSFAAMTVSVLDGRRLHSRIEWSGFGNDTAWISIPEDSSPSSARALFLSYRGLHRLLGGKSRISSEEDGQALNSRIVSLTLTDEGSDGGNDNPLPLVDYQTVDSPPSSNSVADLEVTVKLHHLRRGGGNGGGGGRCAAWDAAAADWRADRCRAVITDISYTECSCGGMGSGVAGAYALVASDGDDDFDGAFDGSFNGASSDASSVSVTEAEEGDGGDFPVDLVVYLTAVVILIVLIVIVVQVSSYYDCYMLLSLQKCRSQELFSPSNVVS